MISNKPKSKQRYLSPSFKKGAIKKEKDKEEEFKLNLILNGAEDDDSESPKKAGKRLSLQTDQRQNMPSPQPKMPSKKHKSVVDKAIIPEPEYIEKEIDDKTKFIILASDGVWEFLDNKMVRDIVMPFYNKNDPDGACHALIDESTKWWLNEDVVVDDITVIAIFF